MRRWMAGFFAAGLALGLWAREPSPPPRPLPPPGSAPCPGRLREIRPILLPPEVREAVAPLPSPDGRFLAFTAPDFRGLWLLDLATSQVRTLSEAPGAGFKARWAPDGSALAFRTATGGDRPLLRIVVAHPDGVTETATPLLRELSLPWWEGRTLRFFRLDGGRPAPAAAGPASRTAAAPLVAASPDGRLWREGPEGLRAEEFPGKVFFLPLLSPDGAAFVVQCLDGHLYLGQSAGGPLRDLGPGSSPSFVREGEALLFERTADDGHALTGSDLYWLSLLPEPAKEAVALTATPDRTERQPALGPDGRTVYFAADGILYAGVLP